LQLLSQSDRSENPVGSVQNLRRRKIEAEHGETLEITKIPLAAGADANKIRRIDKDELTCALRAALLYHEYEFKRRDTIYGRFYYR
jgi:hypothetical protein